MTLNELVEHLRRQASNASRITAQFRLDFDRDAAESLTWSDNVFEAAAELRVFERVIKHLTKPESKVTFDSIRGFALEEAVHGARYPKHSTSPVSNLVAEYETRAWAKIYELTMELGL